MIDEAEDQIGRDRLDTAGGKADHQHPRLPVDRAQRLVERIAPDRVEKTTSAPLPPVSARTRSRMLSALWSISSSAPRERATASCSMPPAAAMTRAPIALSARHEIPLLEIEFGVAILRRRQFIPCQC
jgi:hypothetical protein